MVTESGRLYHFNLGLGQSWNHPLCLPYGVAPPKRAVLPEGYKFSENLLYINPRPTGGVFRAPLWFSCNIF